MNEDRSPQPKDQSNAARLMDPANVLTLCGAAAGLGCALSAVTGRISVAVLLLMLSGLCDLLDGFLARRMRRDAEQKSFGARLDSLSDVCSFGFAPAILLFSAGMRSLPESIILAAFLASVIWRLAIFDSRPYEPEQTSRRHFTGLPCTYVALVLPVIFAIAAIAPHLMSPPRLRFSLVAAAVGLALAMSSKWRVPKPGGKWYGIFIVIALIIAGALLFGAPLQSQL